MINGLETWCPPPYLEMNQQQRMTLAGEFYLEWSSRSRSGLVTGVVVVVVTSSPVPGLGHVLGAGRCHEGVEVVDGSAVAHHGGLVRGGEAQVGSLEVVPGHGVLAGVLRHLRHYLGVEGDCEGRPHSVLIGVLVSGRADLNLLVRGGRSYEDE